MTTNDPSICFCGARMIEAGIGAYPYPCIAQDERPDDMVYIGCENGHTCWSHGPAKQAYTELAFARFVELAEVYSGIDPEFDRAFARLECEYPLLREVTA